MQLTFPSTLRRCRDHLQVIPWLSLIGYSAPVVIYGLMFCLLLPSAWQRLFAPLILLVPLLLLAAKDLAGYPMAVARWKAASVRGESWLQRVAASQPPEFKGYFRLERAMWRGFFSWVLRRPHPPLPAGQRLGYLERGSYGTVICCVLIGLFVEVPIDVFIASIAAKTPEQARVFHIVFGLSALYSFVWVMGDRWQVLGRGHHVLTATSLELDIGVRGCGSIPLDAIAGFERLKQSRAQWCKRHGYCVHATRKLSPYDAPNTILLLKPGCDVRLHLLQVERGGDGPIFLYLDRPDLLGAAICQFNARFENECSSQ